MAPRVKRQRTYGTKKKVPVAKNVKQYVKRCMDRIVEDKWTQNALVAINPGIAGTVTQLGVDDIQRGTTANTRIGNHIRAKFLDIRGVVGSDPANPNGVRVRVMIVADYQCNGAVATISDVFDNSNVLGMYNPLYVQGCGGKRFKIVYDKTWDLDPSSYYDGGAATAKSGKMKRSFHWRFKPPQIPSVFGYDADTGAITDLQSTNVFMVSISDDADCDLNFTTWWCYQDA